MPKVYVSIGSNVDAEENIRSSITHLERRFGTVELSPVYRSSPVGFEGEPFLNLVAGIETELDPHSLIRALRTIEERHGRTRQEERFAPRTLDIDLLLYGDAVETYGRTRLPRPEILQYAFVLKPLADIAGNERHPVKDLTYNELWRHFRDASQTLEEVEFNL